MSILISTSPANTNFVDINKISSITNDGDYVTFYSDGTRFRYQGTILEFATFLDSEIAVYAAQAGPAYVTGTPPTGSIEDDDEYQRAKGFIDYLYYKFD